MCKAMEDMITDEKEEIAIRLLEKGKMTIEDIEDYERDRAEKKLLMKLQEAEEAVKDGEGWLNLDELKALVGE